jgi:hypothetical protein
VFGIAAYRRCHLACFCWALLQREKILVTGMLFSSLWHMITYLLRFIISTASEGGAAFYHLRQLQH